MPSWKTASRASDRCSTFTEPSLRCSGGAPNTEASATQTPQPKKTAPMPYGDMPRMNGVKASTVKNAKL
ncbi:hypothetical protein D3C83_277240 [compost metagenome]